MPQDLNMLANANYHTQNINKIQNRIEYTLVAKSRPQNKAPLRNFSGQIPPY